jgi:hypothetical protein
MFTVSLANQADEFEDLLENYFPDGARIIDFTYGTGALYWSLYANERLQGLYTFTKTDASPSDRVKDKEEIIKLDLTKDDYSHLGLHDVGIFDPPYLIGRPSFDYPSKSKVLNSNISGTQVLAMQYQGPRSWAAQKLDKFVCNLKPEVFRERLNGFARVAPTVIKDDGLLFVKLMNPRHDGKLMDWTFETKVALMKDFEKIDEQIYIRQGSTTWKPRKGKDENGRVKYKHLQNLHGFWTIFQKRKSSVPQVTLDIASINLIQRKG